MIIYEYPFNERIRTLLRLEDLYERFQYFLAQEHSLQHHVALSTIFEMLEVAGRADLKSDLLQELERQKQTLTGYRAHPNVQADVLDAVLADVEKISTALVNTQGKTGQTIRDNEWLMSIRGRTIIPGGACEFDLPSYYAWQKKPAEKRQQDIENWFAPLTPLLNAISMVLRLMRDSGTQLTIVAQSGSYQQMLQGKTYQMLRLSLDPALNAIPEASANKYMLWVRFTSQDGDMKPKPIDSDIPFELTLC
ncbi:cell division protein ZapD [Oxalobacter sp. OttesenSCG-928-P03]|nr:cell division protein ZapD [Oxalobacter sp. OttesenSCG-928-P03]